MIQNFKAVAEAITKDCGKTSKDIAEAIDKSEANYSNDKKTKDNLTLYLHVCDACEADLSVYVSNGKKTVITMDGLRKINKDIEKHSRVKNSAIAVERTASNMLGIKKAVFKVVSKTNKEYFFKPIN